MASRFAERGFVEVHPSYGSVLLPLFEEDGLRMGQIAQRARMSKQMMTTLVRMCQRDGLVARERDLRHTYGSLLAAAGVDLVTIQAAMGHGALVTTGRYLHARPAWDQAAMFTRAFQADERVGTAGGKAPRAMEARRQASSFLD